jgi:hypothetical protein
MTREDIIRMYKEANGWSPEGFDITVDELEAFAKLVAAKYEQEIQDLKDEILNLMERRDD